MKLSNIFSLLCLASSSAIHGALINPEQGNTGIQPGTVNKLIEKYGGAKLSSMPNAKSSPKADTMNALDGQSPQKVLVDPTLRHDNYEPRIFRGYDPEVRLPTSFFIRAAKFPEYFDIYIVKKGDTVESIAKRFGVDKVRLASINKITTIEVNDLLKIPQERLMSTH